MLCAPLRRGSRREFDMGDAAARSWRNVNKRNIKHRRNFIAAQSMLVCWRAVTAWLAPATGRGRSRISRTWPHRDEVLTSLDDAVALDAEVDRAVGVAMRDFDHVAGLQILLAAGLDVHEHLPLGRLRQQRRDPLPRGRGDAERAAGRRAGREQVADVAGPARPRARSASRRGRRRDWRRCPSAGSCRSRSASAADRGAARNRRARAGRGRGRPGRRCESSCPCRTASAGICTSRAE